MFEHAFRNIDELRFRSQTEKHELSHLYEAKIKNMGNGGEEIAHRSPAAILKEIATLDAESAEVLAGIRKLLWKTMRRIRRM